MTFKHCDVKQGGAAGQRSATSQNWRFQFCGEDFHEPEPWKTAVCEVLKCFSATHCCSFLGTPRFNSTDSVSDASRITSPIYPPHPCDVATFYVSLVPRGWGAIPLFHLFLQQYIYIYIFFFLLCFCFFEPLGKDFHFFQNFKVGYV